MKLRAACLPAALAIALLALPAFADTLLVQRAQAAERRGLPQRGMSMAQVQENFGAPARKHAPVGGGSRNNPPITRWDYPAFSVYFEHGHVVDSVVAKASDLEIGPAPARN
jgi:hypothetical protein